MKAKIKHQSSGWRSLLLKMALYRSNDMMQVLMMQKELNFIDDKTFSVLKGALSISERRAREVMTPRSKVEFIALDSTMSDLMQKVAHSPFSRFPVVNNENRVVAIFLMRDFVKYLAKKLNVNNQPMQVSTDDFDMQKIIRPAFFEPESRRIDVILHEMRSHKQHAAIVMDEYGDCSGLITIEDILEEIVGEIQDEHDLVELDFIRPVENSDVYMLYAQTPIEIFNSFFSASLSDEGYHTIGGLVSNHLGYLPQVGEDIHIDGFSLSVDAASSRKIESFLVKRLKS